MNEAKISLNLEQICELAPGFRAELRRVLIKLRKPRDTSNKVTKSSETQVENVLISTSTDDQNGCCPKTTVTLNNKFQVNALLDGGAVPNIIYQFGGSKETWNKRFTPNPLQIYYCKWTKKSSIRNCSRNKIGYSGRTIEICSYCLYNHHAFPLLLGRRVLKRLEIITDWETCTWSM